MCFIVIVLSSVDISGSSGCFAALCQKKATLLFVYVIVIFLGDQGLRLNSV